MVLGGKVARSDSESPTRGDREIRHGQWLAAHETETVWGWGTPAGVLRASRRAALIAEGAQLRAGVSALEIGCGTGLFTEAFAATGARIVAVDISPELLAIAKTRGLSADQVTFVAKPFEDCAVDGPFDAIVGSSVLHHLDVDLALKRIRELLNPGGVLSFAEPNYLNPQVFLERKLRFLPFFAYTSADEIAFVRWSLARRLRSAGFTDISITPFDWLHPSTPKSCIKLVQGVGRMIEKLPLLREFSGSVYIRARRP
jgi:2-polyprenyl-3-methyl-5-hydroxy-6-metoxy-1,4-benzoquinol methylase